MSDWELVCAGIGFAIIVVTLWHLRKGVAQSNGERPKWDDSWMSNDWPGGPHH